MGVLRMQRLPDVQAKGLVCALEHLVPWGTDMQPVLVITKTLLEKAEHNSSTLKATDRDTLGWEEASLMDKPWFDQEADTLLLDEYVVEMDSYRRIVEDEAITDEELLEQTQRVASLPRTL
jgi:hypothetical protein